MSVDPPRRWYYAPHWVYEGILMPCPPTRREDGITQVIRSIVERWAEEGWVADHYPYPREDDE